MLNSYQSHQLWRLRWTAFLIVVLAYVLSFFHRYAPATIAGDLQITFNASSVELKSSKKLVFGLITPEM